MQSVLKVLTVPAVFLALSVAHSGDQYWVTSETLNRRVCPESSFEVVGKYLFREAGRESGVYAYADQARIVKIGRLGKHLAREIRVTEQDHIAA